MEKLICIALVVFGYISSVFSQVTFSGTGELAFNGNIAENGNYSSLLNSGNLLQIQDVALSTSLISKIDAQDEKSSFSAWFTLKAYPIGQALLTASTGNPLQEAGSLELNKTIGNTIISFDLMRLSANVYLTDFLSMEVGRQSMLSGYGYGWNPIDFANPLKNPMDPHDALRGVDGISFKFFIGENTITKFYGLLPPDLLSSGMDYEEIKAGGEFTFIFMGLEIKVAGFYDYDASIGSDPYTPSLGLAFMADIWGMGLYGEGALRKGSRNNFTDGGIALYRKKDWLFSALVGLEYTFTTETSVVLEYFYNGEGNEKSERQNYKESLIAIGVPTADLYQIYLPGYFAKHYVAINLIQPLYDINTDIMLSAIFSPDSGSLTIIPSVSVNLSSNFTGKLSYIGMFHLYDKDFSEVSALPVKHIINTLFTYSF